MHLVKIRRRFCNIRPFTNYFPLLLQLSKKLSFTNKRVHICLSNSVTSPISLLLTSQVCKKYGMQKNPVVIRLVESIRQLTLYLRALDSLLT